MTTQYRCYRKNFGYIAKKQDYGSIYLTFTENPSEAKIYKTKQTAARAHNFQSWQSEKAKEELIFEEVEIQITIVENKSR